MKKIKNVLAETSYIDVIGSILLYGTIITLLILFFFYSVNYIPHFTIASFGVLSKDNYFIIHPQINYEKEEFRKQKKINELFKLNIRKCIKNKKSKNFILDKNVFIYKNN